MILVSVPGVRRVLAAGNAPALEEVEVVGKSGKGEKDKSAEDDALKQAVLQVATGILGEKVAAEKKDVLASKILSRARRYVPEVRTSDRTEAGGTVLLKVRAKVAVDLLKADLTAAGLILVEAPARAMTRVVVLPAASKSGTPPWWAQGGTANSPDPLTYTLVEALRAKGFVVTEPRRSEPDPQATVTPPPAPPAEMTRDNLLAVARGYDVDVFVRVAWETATATRALDGLSYAVARAKVGPVEAISSKDGAVIATVTGEGQSAEPFDPMKAKNGPSNDALSRISDAALKQAALDAAARLTAALGDPVAKGGGSATVKLVVAGLDTYLLYARFDQAIGHDLKSVRSTSLHSIERNEAVFEVGLDRGTDAAGFADEIAKREFDGFTVKVTEKTADRVVVHVGH